ncbi:ferritin-like domain-containing protein [Streptomyces sp. NPDC002671]
MTGTRAAADGSDGLAPAPFRRRNFLASAALAATAPVAAAEPAQAAALPAGGPPDPPGCHSVAHLLAVLENHRGVDWLRKALQVAVALELSTIPPYLCALWSVKDGGCEAARLIRRVVLDEMYHLGVVCNLLVAVGGRPRIKDAALAYPGPLPGGVHRGVNVYLSGLTRSFVHDVMMAIEAPDIPLTREADARRDAPSIGDFYGHLLRAFRTVAPELSTRGQLSSQIGSDVLQPVQSLDDVERSLEIIKEQGEGTGSSPDDAFKDDHPAHYYAFGEIYHGRRLREGGGGWRFTGPAVPFPAARPMARVPAGGWLHPPARVQRLLDQFDSTYNAVLDALDAAWGDGGGRSLGAAIHAMRGLEAPAVELMEIKIPDAPGHYGPQFRRL